MTTQSELSAPFADEEHRTFTGRGGINFTYIEDETVMDRFDQVLGVGNWQIVAEPQNVYEGVVKVRLGVRFPDSTEWVWYEDFGYPNNKDGDALKESVSDGIRRVGRYIGVGRYLYRKDTHKPVQNGHSAPVAAPVAPRSSTATPDDLGDLDWDHLLPSKPEGVQRQAPVAVIDRPLSDGEGLCPVHGTPWVLKPGGTAKATGKPYDPFFACGSDERPFCKEKPTVHWIKANHP